METELYSWINTVTGLETVQEPYAGERPENNHASFRVISFVLSENSIRDHSIKDSNTINDTYHNNAIVLVSISITGYQAYSHLSRLIASRYQYAARKILTSLAISRIGSPQNTSFIDHAENEERWSADFEFNVTLSNTFDLERLNSLILNGEFSKTDNTGNVDSIINYP